MNPATAPAKFDLHLDLLPAEGDCVHILGSGEIILQDFQPEQDPLLPLLGPVGYSARVLLNLERTTLLDTSGVTWLVTAHRAFQHAGGVLVLHSIPARVRMVLKLLHLDQTLYTADNAAAARARAEEVSR